MSSLTRSECGEARRREKKAWRRWASDNRKGAEAASPVIAASPTGGDGSRRRELNSCPVLEIAGDCL
jgi:hypothetical protein